MTTFCFNSPQNLIRKPIPLPAPKQKRARIEQDASDPDATLIVRRLKGSPARWNDWFADVIDEDRRCLYLYGGCPPGHHGWVPSRDFYRLDIDTLRWTDLTNSLFYAEPYSDPFHGRPTPIPRKKPLPALLHSANTLARINNGAFMLLFSGQLGSSDHVVSTLIAIDLHSYHWWDVPIHGLPITPRLHAKLVAVGHKFFIFGGEREMESSPLTSYSVIEYSAETGSWSCTVVDEPYPAHVPPLGIGGDCVPIYNGKKILLFPGREDDRSKRVTLVKDRVVYFHTENRTFTVAAEMTGELPGPVGWFRLFNCPSASSTSSPSSAPSPNTNPHIPKKRGRPRRHPLNTSTPSKPLPMAHHTNNTSSPPSAMVCAWIERDKYLTPELYHYLLPPEEKIVCLNLSDRIWNLEKDLQGFFMLGNRLFLIGYDSPDGVDSALSSSDEDAIHDHSRQSDGDDGEDCDESREDAHKVWNVCVEVVLSPRS